ncbi:MAG TPA: S53 family peptidase [Pseudobacteroides sp.]|uniref:S53 family peptidase n=1 Tax=Pseudobacteroides sp. TaxID=1968840 RepID=UPI002F95B45F
MNKKAIILGIVFLLLTFTCLGINRAFKTNGNDKIKPSISTNIFDKKKSSYDLPGYEPSQIKKAYGINKISATGKGQKIGIIVAYGNPTIEKDLRVFNDRFNLKSGELQVFYPDGKPAKTDDNWVLETSMDVEWTHALAPNATILLVVAKSESKDDLASAVNHSVKQGAHIVTMSWGCSEFSDMYKYDRCFKDQETVYVASAGNNGADVQWPAVSKNVLAVGGTTFSLTARGNLIEDEIAWSGSGGGISSFVGQPEYQKKYGIKSYNYRAVPDVSFFADPGKGISIYSSKTGWTTSCGTSFGTQAWGAFIALVNQNRKKPISKLQEKLYQLADRKKYTKYFRDITFGSNGLDAFNNADSHYDFVTGLGSPIADKLYYNLID